MLRIWSIDPMTWINWLSHRGHLKRMWICFVKLFFIKICLKTDFEKLVRKPKDYSFPWYRGFVNMTISSRCWCQYVKRVLAGSVLQCHTSSYNGAKVTFSGAKTYFVEIAKHLLAEENFVFPPSSPNGDEWWNDNQYSLRVLMTRNLGQPSRPVLPYSYRGSSSIRPYPIRSTKLTNRNFHFDFCSNTSNQFSKST